MGRNLVPIAGAVAGLVFVLTQLTGSDVDRHAAQAVGSALALLLFMVAGSAGAALTRWQPRFALLGIATATLALLACGATIVLIWSGNASFFGFFFEGTSGTVATITQLLALTAAAICVLVATVRPAEDIGTRLTRIAAIGALATLVALAILVFVDNDIEIGAAVYAILATVFVVATAVLLTLRLLPLEEDAAAEPFS